jgi:hypothetical protein
VDLPEPSRNHPFRLSGQKGRVAIALLAAIVIYDLTFGFEIGLRSMWTMTGPKMPRGRG